MTAYRLDDRPDVRREQVMALYRANDWSAAEKPAALMAALKGSDTLITAWSGDTLIGLGNAISDGHLVVYYPHLLVHPDWQGKGIGRAIMTRMQERYSGIHQQMLTAEAGAVTFYERCGFTRAGRTEPMWIYEGEDA